MCTLLKISCKILISPLLTVGGLGLNDEPLICGGRVNTGDLNECFVYRDKEWVAFYEMNEARVAAAAIRTPSKELIITGGNVFQATFVS